MTADVTAVPAEDVQLRFRGLRIHAQVCGEGEPLLLYSGIWGEVRLWDRLLPHLAGFRTIAFDPPGIGRSQRPPYPLSMWSLAQMGTAILDEFGVGAAHVLGASFGGAVAQQMAFSHPRRVRRLVLVSTSFGGGAMPGNLEALWHFIHPRSYHPERLERVGRRDVRRAAEDRAGTGPLHAYQAPDRHPGRLVPDGRALRLVQPALAVGHRPAHPGRGRRR